LPLALLIVAVLAAGIVTAFLKADDEDLEVVQPTPTVTGIQPTESPFSPSPEPTLEPTEEPTPEPTEEPSPEPTEEPSPEPTEEGNGGGGGNNGPVLADTGGPVLPWLVGGALLFAGGAGLWRLRRQPD
jgi:hypothetical protein